jgi:hypothetical protein
MVTPCLRAGSFLLSRRLPRRTDWRRLKAHLQYRAVRQATVTLSRKADSFPQARRAFPWRALTR